MKKMGYERIFFLSIGLFSFFFLELIFFLFLYYKKMLTYQTIQGVYSNHSIVLFLNEEERNKIYANRTLYVEGERKKYTIKNDFGEVLQEDNQKYYRMEVTWDGMKHYIENDSITMSIQNKKIKMIEIFHMILEGD